MKKVKISFEIFRVKDQDQLRVKMEAPHITHEMGCLDWYSDDGYWGEGKWLKREILGMVANLNIVEILEDLPKTTEL